MSKPRAALPTWRGNHGGHFECGCGAWNDDGSDEHDQGNNGDHLNGDEQRQPPKGFEAFS